jgi:glutathione synthase/RimK-type ligase-like ATP-grasp enzyme
MSTRPNVAVATSALAPALDEDGELLLEALASAGLDARPALWTDGDESWESYDAVLVRSVWDYPMRRAQFLDWAGRCRRIANPSDLLTWNTDKHYLGDLQRRGVAVVPTRFIEPGESYRPSGTDVVIKPAVSSSAADTGRFFAGDPAAVEHVARLHDQGRSVMTQPYLDGIDTDGETSLVFLGGELSHAMRREPLLAATGVRTPVVVADVLSTVRPVTPTDAQAELAHAALDAAPGGRSRLTYARVDLIPGPDGPVVLELEATDCFLFLAFAASDARRRLAEHFAARIRSSQAR